MLSFRLAPLNLLLSVLVAGTVTAQIQTLSSGKTDQAWQSAQLQLLDQQLADNSLPEDLRVELAAQKKWLARWQPPGTTTDAARSVAPQSSLARTRREPDVDPAGHAAPFRARLFSPSQRATVDDTRAFQQTLIDQPNDLGLRQLQVQWLDQPQYRNKYWREICDTCDRAIALLKQLPQDDETKLAMAFILYRQARAWAHGLRLLDSADDLEGNPNRPDPAERENLVNTIVGCHQQIELLVGPDAGEFFALKIFALRRDGWTGRALAVLETHAAELDPEDYRAEQMSMLETLGWTAPVAALKRTATERSSVQPTKSESDSASSPAGGPIARPPLAKLDFRFRNMPPAASK